MHDTWVGFLENALLGYDLERESASPGGVVSLTLYWQALASLDDDYTVFVHLLGEHNPATNGPLWAGHDGQPDGGRYPTSRWQSGEIVRDDYLITIPENSRPQARWRCVRKTCRRQW